MSLLMHCMLLVGIYAPVQPPATKPVDPATANQGQLFQFYDVVQLDSKKPTTLEQAIAQAFVNHPDMRLAEAELRVAEAKLAQARVMISQKVTEAFHQLQKERADVELANANWERMTNLLKNSAISQEEYRVAQNQLASAKTRLATIESAWKLMMGSPGTKAGTVPDGLYHFRIWNQFSESQHYEVYQPVSDKVDAGTADVIAQLKAKLGTRVKLEKQSSLNLEQAFQKVTEGAGLKVRVKLPINENKVLYKVVTQVEMEASDYPLRTWLQLIVDEMNNQQAMTAQQGKETPRRYELYVREYGLLLTSRDLAPPDAITVQDLWKQSQFEKAAAEAKKAQDNAAPKK